MTALYNPVGKVTECYLGQINTALAVGTVAILQGVPQCATAYHDMPRERGKFSTEFRGKLPTYTVAATNGFPRGDKKSVAKF